MLVITRREGQEIVIRVPERTNPIVVHCCLVKGERTRTGVTADKDITIHRREIDDVNQAAVAAQFGA